MKKPNPFAKLEAADKALDKKSGVKESSSEDKKDKKDRKLFVAKKKRK